MSQFSYQPSVRVQETNGLAIAGFVCSLIGLVSGGILSPIGLIMSLVALSKPGGRGFAIAGVILGLLGSCGLILLLLIIPAAVLAVLGLGVAIALAEPDKMELTTDMAHIAIAAKIYEDEQGVLPADLGILELQESVKRDPWGNPYEYHFVDNEPGFDISSRGKDGEAGTEDDIYLSKLGEAWEAPGAITIDTKSNDEEGTVTLRLGGKVLTLHGDQKGGRITIDTGEKILELTGDENGAHIITNGKDDDGEGHEGDHDDEDHPEDDHEGGDHDGDETPDSDV